MTHQPTIEQRIEAAMALAGLDYDDLAERIKTPNYGSRTLRRITDPNDTARQARGPDLHLIGKACGVSDAFWTVDFGQLGVATDDVARKLAEHDAQLRDLKAELGEIGEDWLKRLELLESRQQDERPAAEDDNPEAPGGGGQP